MLTKIAPSKIYIDTDRRKILGVKKPLGILSQTILAFHLLAFEIVPIQMMQTNFSQNSSISNDSDFLISFCLPGAFVHYSGAQSVQFVRKHWSHAERMCARTARYVNIQNQLDIHFICLSPLKYFGEQRHTLWGENCSSKCYRQNLPVKVIRRVMDELQPPHCFKQTNFYLKNRKKISRTFTYTDMALC